MDGSLLRGVGSVGAKDWRVQLSWGRKMHLFGGGQLPDTPQLEVPSVHSATGFPAMGKDREVQRQELHKEALRYVALQSIFALSHIISPTDSLTGRDFQNDNTKNRV